MVLDDTFQEKERVRFAKLESFSQEQMKSFVLIAPVVTCKVIPVKLFVQNVSQENMNCKRETVLAIYVNQAVLHHIKTNRCLVCCVQVDGTMRNRDKLHVCRV